MNWLHKWGKHVDSGYYERLQSKGLLRPEDEVPPGDPYFTFYLTAFKELSSCRASGMGIGPIPFTAILEYSRLYDVGDLDDFIYLIRLLDDAYLKLEQKNTATDSKGKNGPANTSEGNPGRR